MIWRSLRAKLTATFAIVAATLVAIAGFAVLELRELEHRIVVDHVTTTMFDLAREVRNRENRLFLFRRQADFKELLESIDATSDFLAEKTAWPTEPESVAALGEIRVSLRKYRELLERYWRQGRLQRDTIDAAEEEIRLQRRYIVDLAEYVSKTATQAVRDDLATQRWRLAVGIALLVLLMVAVARFLTRRLMRPLKAIENQMEQVADGRIDRVGFSWPDRELVSLAGAFNHVMTELELRQSRATQAEKLAALGTMLSGVAHELNNPLSNISTTVQIVSEEVEHLSVAEVRRLLERIDEQTERARNIVRTLLEYARADRGQVRTVDAIEIVEGAVDAINQGRPQVRPMMLDGPVGLSLPANAERLQRALINLIDNAIAATGEDDPIVVTVRPTELADGAPAVEFAVQDCGGGLSPAECARIFDPFYTTKPVGEGTGLGLYIAHEIVKQHGGSLDVVSIPGGGTSVSFRLPAQQRKAES